MGADSTIIDTERLTTDDAYRQDMRHRFETDHFFAAMVVGFNDFNRRAHQPAVDLYFPKNRNVAMRDQHRKHKRLHLDPRHTFKTTLKRVDRIQWIAAFPEEVTFLVQSATQPLAKEVCIKTAMAFYVPRGSRPRTFHLMYPELVVTKFPEDGTWNTPNRLVGGAGDLDHTLAFTSPKSSQSGWHPFVMEPDDVEDANNSGINANPDVRQGVIDVCDQNENLLRDGGFFNGSGTRYHPFDYYAKLLERAASNPDSWEVLVRCSVKTKDGSRLLPGEFPEEEDCELQFPEFANLSYHELREKFHANYESFMCQQQNDPQGGNVATFDEKLYDSCAVAPERVPQYGGETYLCWRLPYRGRGAGGEYAEGVAARVVDGKVYIVDCWQGKWIPSRLAERIVLSQREYDADGVMILTTPGSEFMAAHIRNEAARKNVSLRIDWVDWEENAERRRAAIERMEPMLKVGRALFVNGMTKGVECRKQFVHFGLIEEDGIIECVSKMMNLVPLSMMRARLGEEELEHQRRRRDDAQLAWALQQEGMVQVNEQVLQKARAHTQAMSKVSNFRMPGLPGGLRG